MQTNTPGSLKEKFGNFGAAPTEQLWNSISSSLDQKEKKRRGIFWWWFGGIAASGLLLFGIYYLGYQAGKSEKNIAEENNYAVEKSDANSTGSLPSNEMTGVTDDEAQYTPDVNSTGTLSSGEMPVETHNEHQNKSNVSSTGSLSLSQRVEMTDPKEDDLEKGADVSSSGSLPAINITVANEHHLVLTSTEKMTRLEYPKIHKITLTHDDNFDASEFKHDEISFGESKWEIGFSVGTQMSLSPKEEPLYFNVGNGLNTDFSSLETIQGTGLLSSQSPWSGTISRPLSIDFSIARTFGKRWSLQSGLGINWTKSTTFYDYLTPSQVNASFFSISVPLVAEFDFVKRKRLEFSTGLGIVNEIPLYLRSSSLYPVLESKTVSKSFISGYMCSGLLNLGVNYRLTEKMKIGLHPNVRHYFFQSMKSDFPVVEKKTWFGANIGLVWEI